MRDQILEHSTTELMNVGIITPFLTCILTLNPFVIYIPFEATMAANLPCLQLRVRSLADVIFFVQCDFVRFFLPRLHLQIYLLKYLMLVQPSISTFEQ